MGTPPRISNPSPRLSRARRRWGWLVVILLALVLLPFAMLGVGVVRSLHVGRDTAALRNCVLETATAEWDKAIEIRTGPLLWGLARAGLSFVDMPAEARAALRAIRSAEVSVHHLRAGATRPGNAEMLGQTDRTMTARGWTRLVGVVDRDQMVAVYLPESTRSAGDVRACVVVLNESDMVLASAWTNLEPLLELVSSRLATAPRTLAANL
jgi:hypothetical protein